MCGRYLIADDDSGDLAEINRIVEALNAKYYGGSPGSEFKLKTGEIYPTDAAPALLCCSDRAMAQSLNLVPAVLSNNKSLSACVMKWGFPKWKGSGVIFNARSESAHEKKPLFAEPLKKRRCVIPSAGYFEWKTEAGQKTKFLFRTPDSKALYMAGLYTDDRFVILTTAANASVKDVHIRMPVVLYESEIDNWLNDDEYIDRAFNRQNIVLEKFAV